MTTQDIFETISSQYFQLTNSEKKVADYVLSHRIDAQYMSISELAEECEVADATISRFCRRLGLGGYNAFKLELAKASMAARTGSTVEHEAAPAQTEDNTAFDALCRQRLRENISALEQTVKLIDGEQLHKAAELLYAARRVVCMGQGSSMVLAEEAWTLFSTISSKFTFIADSHFQLNSVALMSKEDVVLFFSYSGSTRELQDVLAVSRPMGVKVILVSHTSPILHGDSWRIWYSSADPTRAPCRWVLPPPVWPSCLYWTCCLPRYVRWILRGSSKARREWRKPLP